MASASGDLCRVDSFQAVLASGFPAEDSKVKGCKRKQESMYSVLYSTLVKSTPCSALCCCIPVLMMMYSMVARGHTDPTWWSSSNLHVQVESVQIQI